MNDVDKLRQAMAQPPASGFAEIDLDGIMRAGGRRRTRRRLLTGAGMVAALAVVTGSVIGVQLFRSGETSTPAPVAAAPLAAPVVDTGIDDATGRVVLRIEPGSAPYTYRLVLASPGTSVTTDCDATRAGFQGVRATAPQSRVPLFGCFVGPVQRIIASGPEAGLSISLADQPELKMTVFWAVPKALSRENVRVKLVAIDSEGTVGGSAEVTMS